MTTTTAANAKSMNTQKILIAVGAVFLAIGGITALLVFVKGHEAMYGVTRQVPWGLLIATYAYFVITSTGLAFIGGLGHAFGFENFTKISRRIVVLAFITLIAGFTQIGMEIGHPFRMMVYLILSPNLAAPILWMGVFYGIELVIIGYELYLLFKPKSSPNDHRNAAIAGFFALIVGALATSNLGFVFGSLNARPFMHGIYFPTFLVVSGVTAGAAILLLIMNIVKGWSINEEYKPAMVSLAKLMGGGIGAMAFLYLWKFLTSTYNMPQGAYESAMVLLAGSLSLNFWVGEMLLAVVVPLTILVLAKGNTKMYGIAGLVFMIGLFFTRYNFIIAGQMVPMRDGDPGSRVDTVNGLVHYSPSIGEWSIFLLGIGIVLFFYFLAEKMLNMTAENH